MSRIPESADVVVIGGGPAGSTAANLLARDGYDVILLDQARHPRPVVGESILPHVWRYASKLGVLEDVENAGFVLKSGGLTAWNGELRQMRLSDFGFDRPGMHVERDRFDQIFLEGARRRGVRAFEEVRVNEAHLGDAASRGVSYEDSSSGESGRIRSRFVVDASGQAAVIANQLRFRQFDPDLRFTSVWGYYENSDYVSHGGAVHRFDERFAADRRPVTFVSGFGDWGWCWHIVQSRLTSVGLVLAPEDTARFKAGGDTLERRFETAMQKVAITSKLLAPAKLVAGSVRAIRDFAYRPTRLCGDGWYLTGDASAFVDPINSAGVVVSFYTGALAARSVAASLARPEKAEHYRSLFTSLVRQRVALYRISALPVGVNSFAEEDYPVALQAARLEKRSEQELLLVQTLLTHRRENLLPLYEMDDRLAYAASTRYDTLPHLVARNGEPLFAPGASKRAAP